jgi:hypothetical protein
MAYQRRVTPAKVMCHHSRLDVASLLNAEQLHAASTAKRTLLSLRAGHLKSQYYPASFKGPTEYRPCVIGAPCRIRTGRSHRPGATWKSPRSNTQASPLIDIRSARSSADRPSDPRQRVRGIGGQHCPGRHPQPAPRAHRPPRPDTISPDPPTHRPDFDRPDPTSTGIG